MTPLAPSAPWPLSQTFTAPSDMTLESVKLWVGEVGEVLVDRLLYIYIRDVNGDGTPGYNDLTYSFVNTSTMTLPGWVEFVLDSPLALTSGTSYSINAYADGGWWEETDMDYLQFYTLGYSTGNPFANGAAYYDDLFMGGFQELSGVDLAFQLWGTGTAYAVTPIAPAFEAVGERIMANGLSWDSADTGVVFDVLFREFGTTGFTTIAENITDLLFAFPYNLTYNQIYFWMINEYTVDPGTGERTLVASTDEQYFTTEALIKYPKPSTRTVPDGLTPPGTMTVITGDNCVAAIRRIVAACNNEIWYEAIE
jgi:hypothetical protein